MKSHYEKTGKLQPKLDAYFVLQREESKGVEVYICSSNWYKTQKEFRESIYAKNPQWSHMKIKIRKGI